jgi:chemotaxis response regulator CheB
MQNRFVVAIGFSEGGLEPLLTFFHHTPHDHATYIILRHVPLEQKSHLHEILKAHSKLDIFEVQGKTPIARDAVYMPPPSMYITIRGNDLYLEKRIEHGPFPNKSIDIFLESLAKSKKKRSIGILLSGGGDDGVDGIKKVKEAGGLVIVQEPATCQYKHLPSLAIKNGGVDYILSPSEMPGVIVHHVDTFLKTENEMRRLKAAGQDAAKTVKNQLHAG